MRILPARVSATKMSPLGATRIWRGLLSPSANSSTLNPAGTCGSDEGGRWTTRETLAAEGVAPGFGKSSALIRRLTPGLSARQSPNAAVPTSCPDWAIAGTTNAAANSNANPLMVRLCGCRIIPHLQVINVAENSDPSLRASPICAAQYG